jgi:hypothetical protein
MSFTKSVKKAEDLDSDIVEHDSLKFGDMVEVIVDGEKTIGKFECIRDTDLGLFVYLEDNVIHIRSLKDCSKITN